MGKVVIELKYDMVFNFENGKAEIVLNNKWGMINKFMEVVYPEYDTIGTLSEGLVAVSKNKKFGFIDEKGKIVIPLDYDLVDRSGFKDGKVLAVLGDETSNEVFYIDKQGNRTPLITTP